MKTTDNQNSIKTPMTASAAPSLDYLLSQVREQGMDLCQVIEALSAVERALYGEIQTDELKGLVETEEVCEKEAKFPGKIALLHTQVSTNRHSTAVVICCLETLINRTVGSY